MSDVRTVYVTKEAAAFLDVSTSYLLRLAKEMNFGPDEMRDTGKRNFLFSQKAVNRLRAERGMPPI